MELTIKNNDELDTWLYECQMKGHDIYSIKGDPPTGATYSDGCPITNKINIGWKNIVTNEVFDIQY